MPVCHQDHGDVTVAVTVRPGRGHQLPRPTRRQIFTGAEAAVYTMHQKELDEADDPETLKQTLLEYYQKGGSPDRAARAFLLDDIIDPRDTRKVLIDGLEASLEKRKTQLGHKCVIYP